MIPARLSCHYSGSSTSPRTISPGRTTEHHRKRAATEQIPLVESDDGIGATIDDRFQNPSQSFGSEHRPCANHSPLNCGIASPHRSYLIDIEVQRAECRINSTTVGIHFFRELTAATAQNAKTLVSFLPQLKHVLFQISVRIDVSNCPRQPGIQQTKAPLACTLRRRLGYHHRHTRPHHHRESSGPGGGTAQSVR